MTRRIQACILVLLLICGGARAGSPAESSLAQQCDLVLRDAVRKPYGWGVPADGQAGAAGKKEGPAVDVPRTAMAAMLLHMAGQDLKNDAYLAAARQLGRGAAVTQRSSGRFPSRATFGGSPIVHETPEANFDRGPTTVAVPALLAILDGGPGEAPVRSACMRGAQWLSKQQTATGGWVVLYEEWSDPQPTKLLRLDRPDFRDGTLALVVAADALGDLSLRAGAARSVELLGRMAMEGSISAKGLWFPAYALSGTASDVPADRAGAIDVLASRNAMQALLAAALIGRNPAALPPLHTAATSLGKLRYSDGRWVRLYALRNGEVPAIAAGPAPGSESVFAPAEGTAVKEDLHEAGTFGLPPLLETVSQLKTRPHEELVRERSRLFDGRQQVALLVSGLSEDLLTGINPQTPGAARAELERQKARGPLAGAVAGEADAQERLYRKLLAVRIERLAAQER